MHRLPLLVAHLRLWQSAGHLDLSLNSWLMLVFVFSSST